jgi:myosin heavy subunit
MTYLYQKEYAQNIKLQGQITELENKQRITAGQLEESKKMATELELKLQEAKTKIDSLASELATEKDAHVQTSNKLEQFKTDLAQQQTLRQDLETRLSQVQEDSKQIKEQIKVIQEQKASLEEKIKNLEIGAANVELGKVVVSPELSTVITAIPVAAPAKPEEVKIPAPVPPAPKPPRKPSQVAKGTEGKIMIVNKEFNFVVINLGSKDKVGVGDEFSIIRAGKSIGDLKVEKVHEFMSAAGFSADLKDVIKENDIVTPKSR